MKKLLLYTVLFFASVCGYAQNLVPNPSFEDTISCPYQTGDIDKAEGWTTFCGSPDYFSSCNQSWLGCPNNFGGFQPAASGNSYAGFISYYTGGINDRELPACTLNSSLVIGTKYYISFKVALSLDPIYNPFNCATNKIGATFATNPYICGALINNNPPVYTDSIITDSLNWTRITGSFVADSAYTYLVIGNFFDDINTDTIKYFNSWWDDFAYYYLDDVCVGTDSMFCANFTTSISEHNNSKDIFLFPNPSDNEVLIKIYSEAEMCIYNSLGQIIVSNSKNSEWRINTSDWAEGVYFVKIKDKTHKLIIHH